ncbi:MAG: FapA family protein [Oscillospiraceae bacterium]|nr:FapA family protein [Oscillospiraceae bacterium]
MADIIENTALEQPEVPQEPPKPPPIDSVGKVIASADGMRANIHMTMPKFGGKHLTLAEIHDLLAKAKIVYGLRQLTINKMAEEPLFDREVLIAEGTPPVKGKDAEMTIHVRISRNATPKQKEDGMVDYKDLGLIENVTQGQLLASKTLPEPGVDGMTVKGIVVRAQKGKEAALPTGKNTYISEDGLSLYAHINGQCDYHDRKLSVMETYTVNGDVSTSTGNINFIGNVVINGNIVAGFAVQAGGNVEVHGCVEGGFINAAGNVLIRDGFHGMYKGEIIAGGSVRSKYIQAGRVMATSFIESQIVMQANIQTADSVKLIGERSIIMGGRVVAKNEIDCYHIGGKNNPVPTVIEVGSDPQLIVRAHELEKEEIVCKKNIADLDRLLLLFKQLESQNRLPPDKREMMERSLYTRRTTNERLIAVKAETEEVKIKLAEEGYGTVRARVAVYPGVRIIIGTEQQLVSAQIPNCRITRGEDGLVFGSAV